MTETSGSLVCENCLFFLSYFIKGHDGEKFDQPDYLIKSEDLSSFSLGQAFCMVCGLTCFAKTLSWLSFYFRTSPFFSSYLISDGVSSFHPYLTATVCIPAPKSFYFRTLSPYLGGKGELLLTLVICLSHNLMPVSQSTIHQTTRFNPHWGDMTLNKLHVFLISLSPPHIIIWKSAPCSHHPPGLIT